MRDYIWLDRKPTSRQIMAEFIAGTDHSFDEMIGPRRFKSLCRDRDELAWRLRVQTNLSLLQIGVLIGGRDHTTILAAVRRHKVRIALSTGYAGDTGNAVSPRACQPEQSA